MPVKNLNEDNPVIIRQLLTVDFNLVPKYQPIADNQEIKKHRDSYQHNLLDLTLVKKNYLGSNLDFMIGEWIEKGNYVIYLGNWNDGIELKPLEI